MTNLAHAMTAKLSWHVQNCDLIGSLESKWEQKEFYGEFSCELKALGCNGSPYPSAKMLLPGSYLGCWELMLLRRSKSHWVTWCIAGPRVHSGRQILHTKGQHIQLLYSHAPSHVALKLACSQITADFGWMEKMAFLFCSNLSHWILHT